MGSAPCALTGERLLWGDIQRRRLSLGSKVTSERQLCMLIGTDAVTVAEDLSNLDEVVRVAKEGLGCDGHGGR